MAGFLQVKKTASYSLAISALGSPAYLQCLNTGGRAAGQAASDYKHQSASSSSGGHGNEVKLERTPHITPHGVFGLTRRIR